VRKLVFIIFIFPFFVSAQGIVVGDTTSIGIIYKNITDTTVKMVPRSLQWVDFDYDGNNTLDIRFKVYQNYSPGFTQMQYSAESLNSNIDFVTLNTDTNYLDTAGVGTLIDSGLNWFTTTTSHYLYTYFYSAGNYYINGLYRSSNYYMAFRHITITDTVYGWFLINGCNKIRSWAYTSHGVGIKEIKNIETSIKVYPNPSSSTISISGLDTSSDIEIINTLGQTVLKMPYENTINVSELAQGIYTLRIISRKNQSYYSKFVKQ
jgi:hypothetical protein